MICTTIGPGILLWNIEPLFNHEDRIIFYIAHHVPGSVLNSTIPEVLNATLCSAQPDPNMLTGNLTSVITIKITNRTVGNHVYCRNGQITEEDPPSLVIPDSCKSTMDYVHPIYNHNRILYMSIALPFMPLLTTINVTYNIEKYSTVFKWFFPGDGEPQVTNYTITLNNENSVVRSVTVGKDIFDYHLYLNYSTNYSVTLYATNCKGSSNSISLTMFEGNIIVTWQNCFFMCSFSWLQCSSGSSEWKSWRL